MNFGPNFLAIGKIGMVQNRIEVDNEYIPPCSSVMGHPKVEHAYNQIGHFFNQIESSSVIIIQKIFQKNQTNDLATITLFLTEKIIDYVSIIQSEFRLVDKHRSPVSFISKVMGLARHIKTSIDLYSGPKKGEFFELFDQLV